MAMTMTEWLKKYRPDGLSATETKNLATMTKPTTKTVVESTATKPTTKTTTKPLTMTEWTAKYRPNGLTSSETSKLEELHGTSDVAKLDTIKKDAYSTGTIKDSTREELLKSIASAKSVGVTPTNEIKELETRGETVEPIVPLDVPYGVPPEISGVVPESNVIKNTDLINSLYDTRSQALMASLDKKRASDVSAFESEREKIEPMFAGMKTQADVASKINARKLSEVMKSSGYDVGTQASTTLTGSLAAQQAQTDIGVQEGIAKTDLARRETEAETAHAYDVLAAQTGLEADKIQSMIEQSRYEDEMALAKADITGYYEGLPTMKREQLDADLKRVEQQYEAGKIDIEQAKWEMGELTDPNSYTNRMNDIELRASEINLEYLPKESQLKIRELQEKIVFLKISYL